MMKNIFIASLLSLGVLMACNGPSSSDDPSSTNSEEQVETLTKLDIGYSRLRISLPVFVAKEKGLFKENGIDANLVMFETAQPLMQALVAGQVDIAGYTALPITYNGMLRSGKDLIFLTTMIEDENHRISYLLRKKSEEGQAAEINSIADLKGKTIGILPTIAYKAWIEDILKDSGLDPETDVVIQQVAPPQQPQALNSGGVDALFTNDPAATTAIELGIAELVSDAVEVPQFVMDPFPFGSFNVSKEWADANPELVDGLANALNQAIDFIESNQDEAKQLMARYLPDNFKGHVLKYPDVEYQRTDESDDEVYNAIADEYLKMGIISKDVDVTDLVIEN